MKKLFLLFAMPFFFIACSAQSNLLENKKFKECPSSPRCVNSQASEESPAAIEPFTNVSIEEIEAVIQKMPRTKIVERTSDYLHAVVTTKWMRFRDDVEFYAEPDSGIVHVRSASRIGYFDFDINRKRVERIRAQVQSKP